MPPGYEPEPYNPEVGNAIHPEAVLLVECPREYVPLSRSGGVAFFTPATNREVIALYLSTKHKLENCPQHYDAARFVLERALRRKLEGSKAFAKLAADAEFNREVLSLAVLEGVFANVSRAAAGLWWAVAGSGGLGAWPGGGQAPRWVARRPATHASHGGTKGSREECTSEQRSRPCSAACRPFRA